MGVNLKWESTWEIALDRPANHRVKRIKIWSSWYYEVYILGAIQRLRSVWGSFCVLWKTSDVEIFKRLPLPHFWSNFSKPLWEDWYHNMGMQVVTFLGDLALKWCDFEFFLSIGPVGTTNCKTLLLPQCWTDFNKILGRCW